MSNQQGNGSVGGLVSASTPEAQSEAVRQFLDNSALDGLEATSARTRNQIEMILAHEGDSEELRQKLISYAKEG